MRTYCFGLVLGFDCVGLARYQPMLERDYSDHYVGANWTRKEVLYARRRWMVPLARLWYWWVMRGVRWMIEHDLWRRGLLRGPEGAAYAALRFCS